MNNGNLFFTNQTGERLPTQAEETTDIEAGDLTGDNLYDIITSSRQSNRLLVNMSAGSFLDQTNNLVPSIGAVEETMDIELVDITANGYLDIFFGNAAVEDSSAIPDRIFINQGQAIFSD